MRPIRSPYQAKTTAPADEQTPVDEVVTDQVAQVVQLRDDQPTQLPAEVKVPAPLWPRIVSVVEGPLADWIARDRPSYLASPVTFVRERWSPQWLPTDVPVVVWAWRVLLTVRAVMYAAFYIPAMVVFLPELTTAAAVAYLVLHFFA
ncbi:hypothetical protein ACOZ38_25050 [Sphaerisporangium viridialbum]|uniref:hypothetical protein n=1 Tax=Sphaerisporangium viridialbum TaxID=46189 RepID=UPI003C789C1D